MTTFIFNVLSNIAKREITGMSVYQHYTVYYNDRITMIIVVSYDRYCYLLLLIITQGIKEKKKDNIIQAILYEKD